MARLIVIADTSRSPHIDAPVLMDEEVKPEHLTDEHASHQITSVWPGPCSMRRRRRAPEKAGRGADPTPTLVCRAVR